MTRLVSSLADRPVRVKSQARRVKRPAMPDGLETLQNLRERVNVLRGHL